MSFARVLGVFLAAIACFAVAYGVSHGSGSSAAAAAPVVKPMGGRCCAGRCTRAARPEAGRAARA